MFWKNHKYLLLGATVLGIGGFILFRKYLKSMLPPLPKLPAVCEQIVVFPVKFKKSDLGKQWVNLFNGPTPQSNWLIPQRVLMSAYPGDPKVDKTEAKLRKVLDANIQTFVCLQTEDELKRFTDYRPILKRLNPNIQILHFPIEDCGIAKDEDVLKFVNELCDRVKNGDRMLIHCFGGHGRTGTIASILLAKLYKLSAKEALLRVEACHDCREFERPNTSPEVSSQFEQVKRLVESNH